MSWRDIVKKDTPKDPTEIRRINQETVKAKRKEFRKHRLELPYSMWSKLKMELNAIEIEADRFNTSPHETNDHFNEIFVKPYDELVAQYYIKAGGKKDILKEIPKSLEESLNEADYHRDITRNHEKGNLGNKWANLKSQYRTGHSNDAPIVQFFKDINDEKPPFDHPRTKNTFFRMVEEFMVKQGIGKFKEEYEKNKKEEYENAPRYSRFGEPPHK